MAKDIDENLSHFLQLEKVASKLSVPSLLVTSDAFFTILDQIDVSLSFMVHNVSFSEQEIKPCICITKLPILRFFILTFTIGADFCDSTAQL